MIVVNRTIAELPAERLADYEACALWRSRDGRRLAFDARDERYLALVSPPRRISGPAAAAAGVPAVRREAPTKRDTSCTHRGDRVGEGPCATCQGRTIVKVYACALHETCAIGVAPEGVRSCRACPDRAPKVTGEPAASPAAS